MSGLVLLDEEQQRTLYHAQDQSQPQPGAYSQYRQHQAQLQQQQQQFRNGGGSRFSLPSSPGSEDSGDFTGVHLVPRTDFTSRAYEPRTDYTTRTAGSPRTNFTTTAATRQQRGSPRTDFTTNEGLPRTNFLTQPSSSAGKPSNATFNSSPRTNFTTQRGAGQHTQYGGTGDSYPILRHDSDDFGSSTDDTEGDGANAANRYAGTSSGLKISVTFIMMGVALGVAIGIVLATLKVSPLIAQWVSLPGDLFLRALKCLVVPYVFCSVAVAIGDIVFVGKVSVIGVQTAKIFGILWVSTTTLGMAVALLFRPLFRLERVFTTAPLNSIGLSCDNGLAATMLADNTISCVGNATDLLQHGAFVVSDINDVFVKNVKTVLADLSLSEQLMEMVTPIVSGNIIASLADSETLSIITFSMVLGSIAGRSYFTKTRRVNYLYLVLLQLRNTFFLAMEWTIWLSPVAVISVIAGSFATNQESLRQVDNVYIYVLAVIMAAVLQTFVLFPVIVFVMTRCNPYNLMRQMVRAYVFAFACSSSLATAPVTLTCIRKAKVCSQSLANFVISIGVTSNVSAVGFYFPIAIVFLAESSGNGDKLTWLRIVGIFALTLLSCAGTPPIPASGLVAITTIYTTIFGVNVMPATFSYVIAMDFLLDRFSAVCDVNDDIMALKVIAENTDETVTQEHLGERY